MNQVISTLFHAHLIRLYPNTSAIIDGGEIFYFFLEAASDLCRQSFTCSQYRHHNTAKFLVACTPNGTISFISPVFVGSIPDIKLTRQSGFLTTLQDNPTIYREQVRWFQGHLNCIRGHYSRFVRAISLFFFDTCKYYNVTVLLLKKDTCTVYMLATPLRVCILMNPP